MSPISGFVAASDATASVFAASDVLPIGVVGFVVIAAAVSLVVVSMRRKDAD